MDNPKNSAYYAARRRYKTHAEAHGEGVNTFIGWAIDETMERDKEKA